MNTETTNQTTEDVNLSIIFIDDEPITFNFDYVTARASEYNLSTEILE